MRHYLKFAALFFGLMALVPLVIGLVSAFHAFAGFMLLVFGLLTAFVALVLGAVVFSIHGVRCAKGLADPLHRAAVVLAGPFLAVTVLLSMLPLVVLGRYLGDQASLAVERPRYQAAPPILVAPASPAAAG